MKTTALLTGDGIFPAVHRDRYDVIDRTNFSLLKWMKRSPAHYQHHLKNKPADTDPKKVGRVVHIAAFEPERFLTSIAIWEGGTRRGQEWDDFKQRNQGKELLTVAEHQKCLAIQKAVRNDKNASKFISRGNGEVTMLWKQPVSFEASEGKFESADIACKGRMDFDGSEGFVDLKTTRDASPDFFGKQAHNLDYWTQGAWYSDGYAWASEGVRKPYRIIAVETTEPYVVQVYELHQQDLEQGRVEYRAWLDKLVYCRARNFWPGYSHDGSPLMLLRPPWARDEDAEALDELTSGGGSLEESEAQE